MLVAAPKPEEMESDEEDVELLRPDEARVYLTARAAVRASYSKYENDLRVYAGLL